MDTVIEKEEPTMESWITFNPLSYVLQFLGAYGWYLVGASGLMLYILHKLQPRIDRYRQAQEDAEYHKDPDKVTARMDAIQRAREQQQQRLLQASERALKQQKEREERKRAEAAESLAKYGAAVGGQRLGAGDDDYLPLSGGASTSTYRPQKKSACAKGGCGR